MTVRNGHLVDSHFSPDARDFHEHPAVFDTTAPHRIPNFPANFLRSLPGWCSSLDSEFSRLACGWLVRPSLRVPGTYQTPTYAAILAALFSRCYCFSLPVYLIYVGYHREYSDSLVSNGLSKGRAWALFRSLWRFQVYLTWSCFLALRCFGSNAVKKWDIQSSHSSSSPYRLYVLSGR